MVSCPGYKAAFILFVLGPRKRLYDVCVQAQVGRATE